MKRFEKAGFEYDLAIVSPGGLRSNGTVERNFIEELIQYRSTGTDFWFVIYRKKNEEDEQKQYSGVVMKVVTDEDLAVINSFADSFGVQLSKFEGPEDKVLLVKSKTDLS